MSLASLIIAGTPIELSADAHLKFVTIHPFADGNGRTARILMNLILMRNGYPLVIIKRRERGEYINCIQIAQKEREKVFFRTFIKKHLRNSIDRYIKVAESGM